MFKFSKRGAPSELRTSFLSPALGELQSIGLAVVLCIVSVQKKQPGPVNLVFPHCFLVTNSSAG